MITQKYKKQNNITVFHDNVGIYNDDYNALGLDKLHISDNKHFWFIARKEFIFQQMRKFIHMSSNILEIGAGTGNVARYLMQHGYKNISVGEMHLNGLKYAKEYGIKECYQFNLLNTPFENEFDSICMFDVLEHIEEDDLALQNVHKSLTNNGKIILTVPSHKWLWNRDDTIAGHKTRYTKSELIDKLQKNGFKILSARYFFITITPLLYLRTILNKDDKTAIKNIELNKSISMNPLLSNILLFISRIENKINNFLPNLFGGSLCIIARKYDSV